MILSPHTVLRAPVSALESFGASKRLNLPMTNLEEFERDHIISALEASNWVVGGRKGAAERLGMKRTTLTYKMRKLGIKRLNDSQDDSRVRAECVKERLHSTVHSEGDLPLENSDTNRYATRPQPVNYAIPT